MAVFVYMGLVVSCDVYLMGMSSSFDILIILTLSDGKVQIFQIGGAVQMAKMTDNAHHMVNVPHLVQIIMY